LKFYKGFNKENYHEIVRRPSKPISKANYKELKK
jgi:hypothetical protein